MDRLLAIERRIREKVSAQAEQRFTPVMEDLTKAFLDLALEYHDLEDFYRLAVLLPKVFLGWEVSLFLAQSETQAGLKASTIPALMEEGAAGEAGPIRVSAEPRLEGEEYLTPLWSEGTLLLEDEALGQSRVIGLLAVRPGADLGERERDFLEQYAKHVALSLVHRLLAEKNQQHLEFIKNLAADISHNVIVPNMFFKAYLRRLAGKIRKLEGVYGDLVDTARWLPPHQQGDFRRLAGEMANATEGLQEEFDHIEKHYHNTSLFLETLLRRSHFEKGHYVLDKKKCRFGRDIIEPQVERYRSRLTEHGIEVDLSAGGVPDQPVEVVADVGLISQVYANLLTNAVKYTRPAPGDQDGRKYISYGLEVVPDAFGPSADGVKLNLFSTGPPLAPEDQAHLFEEGFRGSNVGNESGTGHGLRFIKEVIELHGGKVGYEATEKGNNFYFILPK